MFVDTSKYCLLWNLAFIFAATSKPCKTGYLLYTDGFAKWKKVFVVLFEDSMMAWFQKPKQKTPICHVTLKVIDGFGFTGSLISWVRLKTYMRVWNIHPFVSPFIHGQTNPLIHFLLNLCHGLVHILILNCSLSVLGVLGGNRVCCYELSKPKALVSDISVKHV